MDDQGKDPGRDEAGEFARAAEGSSSGIVREFFDYLRHTGKWWLTPIVLLLLLLSGLSILAGTGVAPFIYALF